MNSHTSIKYRYLSIINGQWQGIFPNIIKCLLSLISYLYRIILKLRYFFFKTGFLKKTTPSVPVISVGNITLGGTGKTPLIEYIAIYLKKRKKKVAILSRGYGAKKVINKSDNINNLETYNDEHLMLCENLSGVPNLINKNRILSAKKAIEDYNVDFLLLDDGFQHIKLDRSLDIVAFNSLNPFGYENVFPRGFLREPLQGLERADLFVITHSNLCSHNDLENIRNRLNKRHNDIPIIETIHYPLHLENISDGTVYNIEWLKEKNLYAFCAIGNPESFSKSLLYQNAQLIKFNPFLDHHFYTHNELEEIIKEASDLNVDAIVTTQKDKVKILDILTKKELNNIRIPINVVKITIKIVKGNETFEKLINDLL